MSDAAANAGAPGAGRGLPSVSVAGLMSEAALDECLAEAETPWFSEIRVTGVGPLATLYASPWVQRLVPTPVAIPLALAAGRLRWHTSSKMRKKTLRWASDILEVGPDDPAARRLARAACAERTVADVLIWRPWAQRRAPFHGFERVLAARDSERGAIISAGHTITLNGFSVAAAARGVAPYTARAAGSRTEKLTGYPGLWKAARIRNGEEAGVRYIERPGTYSLFRALLERGEICTLMFDVEGDQETQWGGGSVSLARGPATLAFEVGVPVIPVVARREGWRFVCRALEPLEPADFADAVDLHDYLAYVLSRELLPHLPQTFPTRRLRPMT